MFIKGILQGNSKSLWTAVNLAKDVGTQDIHNNMYLEVYRSLVIKLQTVLLISLMKRKRNQSAYSGRAVKSAKILQVVDEVAGIESRSFHFFYSFSTSRRRREEEEAFVTKRNVSARSGPQRREWRARERRIEVEGPAGDRGMIQEKGIRFVSRTRG